MAAVPVLSIRLASASRVYTLSDMIKGSVIINLGRSDASISHKGLQISFLGVLEVSLDAGSVGLFDAAVHASKTSLPSTSLQLLEPGKLSGTREIPFSLALDTLDRASLYESYGGRHLRVSYQVRAEMAESRLLLDRRHTGQVSIAIVRPSVPASMSPGKPLAWILDQSQYDGKDEVPEFRLACRLDATECRTDAPLTGTVHVEKTSSRISAIEVRLMRVEVFTGFGDASRHEQISQIGVTQVCDGAPTQGILLPLWIMLPRAQTCATVTEKTFAVRFELELVVSFDNAAVCVDDVIPFSLVRPELERHCFLPDIEQDEQ